MKMEVGENEDSYDFDNRWRESDRGRKRMCVGKRRVASVGSEWMTQKPKAVNEPKAVSDSEGEWTEWLTKGVRQG
jgi:hypothetical protein